MKYYFSVHCRVIIDTRLVHGTKVTNDNPIGYDTSITSIADSEELAIVDMKAQVSAITLERGQKLELISFQLQNIEV